MILDQISATEANRQFSKLLHEVAQGSHITITREGTPVAVLSPVADTRRNRRADLAKMSALLREGLALDHTPHQDRDQLHQR